ncbi:DUF1848 domain-containing protein [Pectinatus sottacetonis]|uniref:DUF1848 domain-containing protein n=1 Tax=Pectinatus sottacetonis TaxID=1002795 RepID=UPI0018C6A289
MKFNGWDKIFLHTEDGKEVKASAPIIISASRATDIPAFHYDWFINRLQKGYVKWLNPFNQKIQYVSFAKTRVIVFWSKNPNNIIRYLPIIDNMGINYYFTYTLNDYEIEDLEPNLPSLGKRIETFLKLSVLLGKEKVIWRFDPLILTQTIDAGRLLQKIKHVGDKIYKYTTKLIISFADINNYKKVQRNLQKYGVGYKEFDSASMNKLAKGLQLLNKKWKLSLATCGEEIDLKKYGIEKNKCIDDKLMVKLFADDKILMDFLGYSNYQMNLFSSEPVYNNKIQLKDSGQRSSCGCIASKDIGQYNTCMHLCKYCYANSSPETVIKNFRRLDKNGEAVLSEKKIL